MIKIKKTRKKNMPSIATVRQLEMMRKKIESEKRFVPPYVKVSGRFIKTAEISKKMEEGGWDKLSDADKSRFLADFDERYRRTEERRLASQTKKIRPAPETKKMGLGGPNQADDLTILDDLEKRLKKLKEKK